MHSAIAWGGLLFSVVSTALQVGIRAIIDFVEMVCGSSGLMLALATACIMHEPERPSFSFSGAEVSAPNHATSLAQWSIGTITNNAYDQANTTQAIPRS
jgi:hypothetical protein